MVLPSLIIVGLMAIPYIDTNKAGNGYYSYSDRKFAFLTFQYGFVVLWVVLILLGTFLRGPNWNFFGPYEFWDLHKVIPLNNVQSVGYFLDSASGDGQAAVDPLAGGAGDLADAWATSRSCRILLYRLFFKKYTDRAGMVRYITLAVLILFMASLAAQDGAALDDQPEIRGGNTRVLLQHLVTRSISQDE